MLNQDIKKQLRVIFDQMAETAFAHPIKNSKLIQAEIETGKFNKLLPFTEHWVISVCLTISPEDDNQKQFWAASLAYLAKHSGKPKSRLLWSNKESMVAKDVLNFLLEEVGLVDEDSGLSNPVKFFGKKVAFHAHKELSEAEKEAINEENNGGN